MIGVTYIGVINIFDLCKKQCILDLTCKYFYYNNIGLNNKKCYLATVYKTPNTTPNSSFYKLLRHS